MIKPQENSGQKNPADLDRIAYERGLHQIFVSYYLERTRLKDPLLIQRLKDKVSEQTIALLEKFHKDTDLTAWEIIMLYEKEFGSGGFKGVYRLKTKLDLNSDKILWRDDDSKFRYSLIQKMVLQYLRQASKDASLLYPTISGEGKWEVSKKLPRLNFVRLVFGPPQALKFIDLPFSDVQNALTKGADWIENWIHSANSAEETELFIKNIESRLAQINSTKFLPEPISNWFKEATDKPVPVAAIQLNSNLSQPIFRSDPRMNLMSLQVFDHPGNTKALPSGATTEWAHLMIDGVAAKQRLENTWQTSVCTQNDQDRHRNPNLNRFKPLTEELGAAGNLQVEASLSENPFVKPSYSQFGAQKIAEALGINAINAREQITPDELKPILAAAKLLKIPITTFFMSSLMMLTKSAPMLMVDPRNKAADRLQIATFGFNLMNSESLKILFSWVLEAAGQSNKIKLEELISLLSSTRNISQRDLFLPELRSNASAFATEVARASDSKSGVGLTAVFAQDLLGLLDSAVVSVSPELRAALNGRSQCSSLGQSLDFGSAFTWEFDSAGSLTVSTVLSILGKDISLRQFMDDGLFVLDGWQRYLNHENSFKDRIKDLLNLPELKKNRHQPNLVQAVIESLSKNHLKKTFREINQWLALLANSNAESFSEATHMTPITINGKEFKSLHEAIFAKGTNAKTGEDVTYFINQLETLIAQELQGNSDKTNIGQFRDNLQTKTQEMQAETILMVELQLLLAMYQSGKEVSSDYQNLLFFCNQRKQKLDRLKSLRHKKSTHFG